MSGIEKTREEWLNDGLRADIERQSATIDHLRRGSE